MSTRFCINSAYSQYKNAYPGKRFFGPQVSQTKAMTDQEVLSEKPYSADDPVVTEIVRRLVDVYRPERIYLFGSAARGEADADSDYDFMVVPDDTPDGVLRDPRGYQAVRGLSLILSREKSRE